jgi:glycosyltransferase involved in cell wall biosynthesis
MTFTPNTYEPLVSIVIPVYNGSSYLREAVDSALSQTYPKIEVLVINDGSTDNGRTEEVARSYGEKIRYFSKPNGGVASALNKGIKEMKGDYFSWLSHDDVYLPDKVRTQIDILRGLENKSTLLYSDFECIDEKGVHISFLRVPPFNTDHFQEELLTNPPALHGCTLLIHKQCFTKAGLFDETLKTTQDYALWFLLAGIYPYRHIPQALVRSRQHAEQGSRTLVSIHDKEKEELNIWMIDRLKEQKKLSNTQNVPARVFLKASVRLYLGDLPDASRYALKTGIGELNNASFSDRIIGIYWIIMFGYRVLLRSMKSLLKKMLLKP